MEFVNLGQINVSNNVDTELFVKEEPESEFLSKFGIASVHSIMAADSSFQGIKSEVESEEEITDRPRKRRRKALKAKEHVVKKILRNGNTDCTQLPCIVNIKSSVVYENSSQNHNRTFDSQVEMPSTSMQFPNYEKTFALDVYEILIHIQNTLEELKAEVSENSQKIDQLQKLLPQQMSWKNVKNEFNFPIATDEQLLELEKRLENNGIANKLFVQLTCRTYNSWREMVLLCLKTMLSRKVAVLYNLNGRKGTKKKFRDLNLCNILVECVQHKYKEATVPDILKRISFILAGARDWEGSRHKNK
ncbi:uncharacterized protein LOC129981890 isoform X2 [Argiope bruennichi]|uniref:uncharacterized protein LOC129981890 isoform X2 n=1 Tax=Argiope bruennichi TaxID=94029 RepID=UPI0024953FBC|nr:uncharacterized protein LOC129981890 isoform X2 [Argiope bruennichi]